MNKLISAVERAVREFNEIEVPYCLVGGLAVSARTEPRFTRDAVVLIAGRGFHRERSLGSDLERYIQRFLPR